MRGGLLKRVATILFFSMSVPVQWPQFLIQTTRAPRHHTDFENLLRRASTYAVFL